MQFRFDNSYARLPKAFHAHVLPTPVAAPQLIKINHQLAQELGLDPAALQTPEAVDIFAGNKIPPQAEPIAAAYSGHQFGHFNPQLGDGRAILLGEMIDTKGQRRDIQLKGSGPTPFSRRGDGRAALGPVLREYIVGEAMHALGIPTTRALAAVTTGEYVYREAAMPGGVLTRVAASHIRVGTFQFFASRGEMDDLRALADYALARHYPELAEEADPYAALLCGVIARQAQLVAQWMLVGFIHGVMNTDNMTISGETIDYGPCAFMEDYHPQCVFSSIDYQARYAYAQQPSIAQWNLGRLAECLLPLLRNQDEALERVKAALADFKPIFQQAYFSGLNRKLGLFETHGEDQALIGDLFAKMSAHQADFTMTFRLLCDCAQTPAADEKMRALFKDAQAFDSFAQAWRQRLARENVDPAERANAMRRVNPAFIARNHRVEEVIAAAVERADYAPFETLLDVISRPYNDRPEIAAFMQPAKPEERVQQTFCGT
jgi:uncharacterized protein YdiU (UPF0061 family)